MTTITNVELGKQAYNRIKALIISKELLPGQKIVQEKLAEQLGISRTPLRSGLQMLEAESLIEAIPRRGFIVKQFSDREVLEIYDCRIALESMAVSLFTEKASPNEIEELSKLFDSFLNVSEINLKQYQKIDSLFHYTLIKGCGNNFLFDLFHKGNLIVCIDLIGLIRPPKETLKEHINIINAIRERNVDLASELVKQHLIISKNLVLNKMKNGK